MPNTDNIKSLADIQALKKEFQFIVGGLSDIKNNIIDLNRYEILGKQKATFRDVTVATKELNTTLEKNVQINRGLVQQQIQEERLRLMKAKALEAEARAEKQVIDLVMKEERERRQNIATIEKENAAKAKSNDLSKRPINSIPFEIKGNLGGDPTDGGQITNLNANRDALNEVEREYADVTNAASASTIATGNYSRELNKQNTALGVTTKSLNRLEEAEKRVVKTEAEAIARNKELIALRRNVDVTQAGSVRQIALYNQQIDANNKLINTNSSALEKQKQNVGNYADGVQRGSNKILLGVNRIFSAIRNIAYILPGVGLAGIFGFLIAGAGKLISALAPAERKLSEFKQQQKAVAEISEKAATELGNEYAKLILIKDQLNNTNIPLAKRVEIAKEYNKTADVANKLDEKNLDNMALVNSAITSQIALLKERALARAAEAVVAQKAESLFLAQEKARQKNLQVSVQATKPFTLEEDGFEAVTMVKNPITGKMEPLRKSVFDKIQQDNAQKRLLAELISKDPAVIKANDELNAALSAATTLIKPDGLTTGNTKTPKTPVDKFDAAGEQFRNQQEQRKALFEIMKQKLQDQISANEKMINDETETFDKRFQIANLSYEKFVELDLKQFESRKKAAQNFYDISLDLIRKQKEFELSELSEQEDEEIRKANKQIKNVSEREKVIQSIRDEYAAKRKLVETKSNSDILKLEEVSEKQFTELVKKSNNERAKAKEDIDKQSLEHSKSLHEDEMADIQNDYDREISLLDKKFARGEIKEKEYNRKKLRLQLALQLQLLAEDIKFTKETIALAEIRAAAEPDPVKRQQMYEQISAARLKLAALEIRAEQAVSDFEKTNRKTRLDEYEEFFNRVKQMSEDVFGVISGFLGVQAENEKNRLQEQIDFLEQKKQKEIEVANQTITNLQDRAAAIEVIEQRAAAQREILEQRQRQADERRARFEKAATIAKIIIETASAVIHQLNSGDPVTAIGRAIAVGALGAAQLAIAVATPIPKYKDGVKWHPGGFAIVGDGGRSEGITMPDGTVFKSPSSATLVDLPTGTSVDPDFSKMQLNGIPDIRVKTNMSTERAIEKMGKDVVMAIKNKREYHMKGLPRHRTMLKDGHTFRRYINDRM